MIELLANWNPGFSDAVLSIICSLVFIVIGFFVGASPQFAARALTKKERVESNIGCFVIFPLGLIGLGLTITAIFV